MLPRGECKRTILPVVELLWSSLICICTTCCESVVQLVANLRKWNLGLYTHVYIDCAVRHLAGPESFNQAAKWHRGIRRRSPRAKAGVTATDGLIE